MYQAGLCPEKEHRFKCAQGGWNLPVTSATAVVTEVVGQAHIPVNETFIRAKSLL